MSMDPLVKLQLTLARQLWGRFAILVLISTIVMGILLWCF